MRLRTSSRLAWGAAGLAYLIVAATIWLTVANGSGLRNMHDRLEALGGSLAVRSAPGAGVTIEGAVPIAPPEALP
jgi:signal transduction histidine kinase